MAENISILPLVDIHCHWLNLYQKTQDLLIGLLYYMFTHMFTFLRLTCTYQISYRWYLKIQYDTATVHYERASQKMHQNFVGVPGLFLFSDNDPVSTPEMNARVYKKWEAKGHKVIMQTAFFENNVISL